MSKKYKNTIYNQKSNFDQFYTNEEIAQKCYSKIWKLYEQNNFSIFLEPSAGTGSFFKLFPESKKIGLDLDPKSESIVKQDFLTYNAPINENIITIGNPPFGRVSSLAVKFFNKAAQFSNVIAFIVPKTFQKKSIQNKLNSNFHLKLNINLPKNSFIFNDEPYDVSCCFQIWEKSLVKRKIKIINLNNNAFDFVKKDESDFAIRRVGGRAGKASLNIKDLSQSSHYFLKFKSDKIFIQDFIQMINEVDFSKIVNSTAGVKSLSKPELITKLRSIKKIKKIL